MLRLLPANQPGAYRVDDERVISGIVRMLENGGRWQDCPGCLDSLTTIYIPKNRSPGFGIWMGMLAALVEATSSGLQMMENTMAKAHRAAAGGKGGDFGP